MSTIDKIISLLEQKNKSQKDLTDYLGIEKSVFTTWKNGKSKSYRKYLKQIAIFLNTTVDYLTDNSDETPPEELVILNRAAKKMTAEKRKQLLEMAKLMFKEDFDD